MPAFPELVKLPKLALLPGEAGAAPPPVEEVLVELDGLVDEGQEEAPDHGPDQAADAVDAPEVEQDDLGKETVVTVVRQARIKQSRRDF